MTVAICAPLCSSSVRTSSDKPAPPVGDVSRPSVIAWTKISVDARLLRRVRKRDQVRLMAVHAAVETRPRK